MHIEGLIKILNLWTLTTSTPMQAYWYIFFYIVWVENRDFLTNHKAAKYFDPDNSVSICYYILDRSQFMNFLSVLHMETFISTEVIDSLYKKLGELETDEVNKIKAKILKVLLIIYSFNHILKFTNRQNL